MFGQIAPYQQLKPYTCSAAALLAVLRHWGRNDLDEKKLSKMIGVLPVRGASVKQVIKAAKSLGFHADEIRFTDLDQLRSFTSSDVPVIVSVVSFTRPDRRHFVVVTNVGGDVVMMDPNVQGNWRRLTMDEMEQRWLPDRTGIVVTPSQLGAATRERQPTLWIGAAIVTVSVVATIVGILQRRT